MQRLAGFASILVGVLFALAIIGQPQGGQAQEATPMPSPRFIGLPSGVTAWEVGEFSQAPSTYLLAFSPGAVFSQDASTNPAITLVYVASGTLTLRVDAPMAVNRAGSSDAPEIVETGVEFTAKAGDYFVLPANVSSETRNDGDEAATAQYAMMDPNDPVIVDPNQDAG